MDDGFSFYFTFWYPIWKVYFGHIIFLSFILYHIMYTKNIPLQIHPTAYTEYVINPRDQLNPLKDQFIYTQACHTLSCSLHFFFPFIFLWREEKILGFEKTSFHSDRCTHCHHRRESVHKDKHGVWCGKHGVWCIGKTMKRIEKKYTHPVLAKGPLRVT